MDKIDRIMEITDRYLERFGKVLIGIYYLPPLAENWKFAVFINSLLITLRRRRDGRYRFESSDRYRVPFRA